MALSSTVVWEVQTGGSNTNGGGYKSDAGTTDYSQQTSPQLTVTDGACSATTTLTSATGGFTAAMVGNVLYLSSGPGWYEIAGYTDTNTVTLDRAGPSASGMTVNVGGCLADLGILTNLAVSSNTIFIKSGTYTLTTSTPGAGGPFQFSSSIGIIGYETTRFDFGAKPVLDAGAVTGISSGIIDLAAANTVWIYVSNIKVDGQSGASNICFDGGGGGRVIFSRCQAVDAGNIGFNTGTHQFCEASGCGGIGINSLSAFRCWSHDNTGIGIKDAGGDSIIADCLSTGNGSHGISLSIDGSMAFGCACDGNTGNGLDLTQETGCAECVSTNNSGYGFEGDNNIWRMPLVHIATYNNTSGRNRYTFTPDNDIDPIVLTGDPWTNAAGNDYTPNNTAGAGAELRGASYGIPNQTNNTDIGAVQHADPAGGGGGGVNRLTGRGLAG